jgi:hypothetical protein
MMINNLLRMTKNCQLVCESPDQLTAIYKNDYTDYFIITEANDDFIIASLNSNDFEGGFLVGDGGEDITDLVKDGETTAADWASHKLLVTKD